MTWNYRILRAKDHFYIGEVYYNRHDEPTSYSGPIGLTGETLEELTGELDHIAEALDYPVLKIRGSELIPHEPEDA